MNRCTPIFRWILIPVLALWFGVCALAADVKLDVSAKRKQLYLGESMVLTVRVSGLKDASIQPDLSRIKDCEIRLLGSHSSHSSNVNVVNGRLVRSSFSGRTFSYEITPSETGNLSLGPVHLPFKGKSLTESGPTVKVVGVENQKWVRVSVSASRESVFIDEPFEVEVTVALKRLPGRYASADPMNPNNPPLLTLPYLDENLPGLVGPNVGRLLGQLLARTRDQAGFRINDFGARDSFGSLFDFGLGSRRTPSRFALTRKDVKLDGVPYRVYTLKTRYIPKEEGEHTFGPVLFKGNIFVGVTADRKGKERPIFAVGPAATVRVVPPPDEGRPESYVGVLGSNLTATAALDVQTCNVGDPLQLTVRISGKVNIEKLRPPPVWEQDAITRRFRVSDDTIQTERNDGEVVYTWRVRPKEPGTYELPPIEVSYYNLAKRLYETVKTAAIPLRVNDVTVVGIEDVVNIGTNGPSSGVTIGNRETKTVAPLLVSSTGAVRDRIMGTRLHGILALFGPLVFLATLLGIQFRSVVRRRRTGYRPRTAFKRALGRLDDAERISGENTAEACRRMSGALRDYLADRSGAVDGSLTPGEAGAIMSRMGFDGAPPARIVELLEKHFNAGFSGSVVSAEDLGTEIHDAKEALKALEDMWKSHE
jgi:hypothetical protein